MYNLILYVSMHNLHSDQVTCPNIFLYPLKQVNGEPAQGTDNRYAVLHHDNSHTIVFESGTRIKVSDKVEFLVSVEWCLE